MKTAKLTTRNMVRRFTNLGSRFFILLTAILLLGGTTYIANAQSNTDSEKKSYHSPAAQEYCKGLTPTVKNNACKDGWDNKQDCNNYQELNFDPSIASSDLVRACKEARADQVTCAKAAKDGKKATGTNAPCPDEADEEPEEEEPDQSSEERQAEIDKLCKSIDQEKASEEVKHICKFKTSDKDDDDKKNDSGSGGGGGGGGGGGQQQQQQQKKDLETLKKSQEPSLPDNVYGSYVNGNNQYQPMRVSKAGGANSPAIIFFNGGGWIADDGVGDRIAPDANQRGYTTFVASYRLGAGGVYYQLDDVMRAINHVKNNAGMYGVDPSRIAIWGDSAGGSLVMRANATGKSGARVAVGWSAPTNAYTALFHSVEAFAIGALHSTCMTSDIPSASGGASGLGGGAGGGGQMALAQDVLALATQAQQQSTTPENITKQMDSSGGGGGGGNSGVSGGERRVSADKMLECVDNMNSASPALFASPNSSPAFLAGFDVDPLVHPGQLYQMRDKLRSMGVAAETLVLPGVPGPPSEENHLGYNKKFVAPSLDFVDKFLHP